MIENKLDLLNEINVSLKKHDFLSVLLSFIYTIYFIHELFPSSLKRETSIQNHLVFHSKESLERVGNKSLYTHTHTGRRGEKGEKMKTRVHECVRKETREWRKTETERCAETGLAETTPGSCAVDTSEGKGKAGKATGGRGVGGGRQGACCLYCSAWQRLLQGTARLATSLPLHATLLSIATEFLSELSQSHPKGRMGIWGTLRGRDER